MITVDGFDFEVEFLHTYPGLWEALTLKTVEGLPFKVVGRWTELEPGDTFIYANKGDKDLNIMVVPPSKYIGDSMPLDSIIKIEYLPVVYILWRVNADSYNGGQSIVNVFDTLEAADQAVEERFRKDPRRIDPNRPKTWPNIVRDYTYYQIEQRNLLGKSDA